ncbi:hypothetical protein DXG03_005639 [Asterophora parasitica]|uniref:Amine oxidase n=1 Tax=Asterophora parasitica TaxID=117018 RepID=A0A9P7GBF6_9AGAR|nr:hypothetical protein DXG03_005639 [Asterophora parasitica]
MPRLATVLVCLAVTTLARGYTIPKTDTEHTRSNNDAAGTHATVLILGGGVAGVIAARTLHEQGIDNFVIVEARDELGGRLKSTTFARKTVELGANWIQGTQTGNGPKNPILTLVEKHKVKTAVSHYTGSLTTYDHTGAVDYLDVFDASVDAYNDLVATAGGRVPVNNVDLTSQAAYTLNGVRPRTAHEKAAEYYQFDWEYAQKPDQTSAIASSWANNFTYDPDQGGFSEDNLFDLDQRGFKAFLQEEAKEFLKPSQLRLNSIVKKVSWSGSGVKVLLEGGSSLSADYALCTFSVGVLQADDVEFEPRLPSYKREAIASLPMGTYTKIFLQFPQKFWFDTEFALYADPERGRYPVWQSLDHKNFLPGSGIIFVTVTVCALISWSVKAQFIMSIQGDYSERIEALPDAQVKSEVLSVLQAMYPNITIPKPLDFMFPRWYSDPLFRGSFSNWPPSFVQQHHDNLRSNVDRLYFAGEATSQKYFGKYFVHFQSRLGWLTS